MGEGEGREEGEKLGGTKKEEKFARASLREERREIKGGRGRDLPPVYFSLLQTRST